MIKIISGSVKKTLKDDQAHILMAVRSLEPCPSCSLLVQSVVLPPQAVPAFLSCFCSSSHENTDHAENAASGSGPVARGRSAVTRRHKFDLAARTLLARAGKSLKYYITSFPLLL